MIFPASGESIAINCGPCCKLINETFSSGLDTIYYSNIVIAFIFFMNVVYISFRLNRSFNSGAGQFLRVYHGYCLLLAIWFTLSIVSLLIPSGEILTILNRVLYATRAFLDNFVIILACFPGISGATYDVYKAITITIVIVCVKICMMFSYAFSFNCGFCPLFYPAPQSAYTESLFFIVYALLLVIMYSEKPFRIRQSVKKWIIYMAVCTLLGSISVFVLIQDHDFAFCISSLNVLAMAAGYGPVIYYVFMNDTVSVVSKNISNGTLSQDTDPVLYYGSKIKEEKNTIKLIVFEDLTLGPKIGIGGFGEVSYGKWNHTEVAIKRVFQKGGKEEVDNFLKEIKLMSKLTHPNILLFIGASVTQTDVYIITEYMPKGSLYSILHKNRRERYSLSVERKLKMLVDISKGMLYLHTFHPPIIHRDLKTQNLLVDEFWRVKLCDFGLSRIKATETMSRLGTLQYSAPEVLRGERYTEKADVYSFSIILWEVITEGIPYDGWPPLQIASDIAYKSRRLDIPTDFLPGLHLLIKDCWHDDPLERPDFSSILTQMEDVIVGFQSGTLDESSGALVNLIRINNDPHLQKHFPKKKK